MEMETKPEDPQSLPDELTGALIGLARAVEGHGPATEETSSALLKGLAATADGASPGDEALRLQIEETHQAKAALAPMCAHCAAPCGKTADYDMRLLRDAPEDVRALKGKLFSELQEMAARVSPALTPGLFDAELCRFFCEGLFRIGYEESAEPLLAFLQRVEEMRAKCAE